MRIESDSFLLPLALLVFVVYSFSSCTIEKQYHSAGYKVSLKSPNSINRPTSKSSSVQNKPSANSRFQKAKASQLFVQTGTNSINVSSKKTSKSWVKSLDTDSVKHGIDSAILAKYRQMDVPLNYLTDYSGQIQLKPYFRHDSIVRSHKIVSVYLRDKVLVGKLMGISESGVFILNNKKSISLMENWESSKNQKKILGKLCYIPYTEIKAIQKGGTFLYKFQIILQPFFQWISLLIVLILSFVALLLAARATTGTGGSGSGEGFKAALLVFLVIGVAVAAVCTFIIGMLLAPPVWLVHQLFWGIPGRYWQIKGDSYRGDQFFSSMMQSPRKLKIIRRRFLRP